MAQQYIYIVFVGKCPVPSKLLLHIPCAILVCITTQTAIVCGTVTNQWVVVSHTVGSTIVHIAQYMEVNVERQVEVQSNGAVQCVTATFLLVSVQFVNDVTVVQINRFCVVDWVAIVVIHDVTICIVYIHRINRSHVTSL